MRNLTLVKHVNKDTLETRFRKERDPRVKERLMAILHFYDGKTIDQTAALTRRSPSSVKRYLRKWNKEGFDGLVPQFDGGPKPRIDDDQWKEILGEMEGKGMTLRDVRVYIKKTRGVRYSYGGVWKVFRKKLKTRYGKPYVKNYSRPEDAVEILKKGLTKH